MWCWKIISELMTINYGKNILKNIIFRPHNVYSGDKGNEHVIPHLLIKLKDLLMEKQRLKVQVKKLDHLYI